MGVIPNIISTSGEFNGKFREKSLWNDKVQWWLCRSSLTIVDTKLIQFWVDAVLGSQWPNKFGDTLSSHGGCSDQKWSFAVDYRE